MRSVAICCGRDLLHEGAQLGAEVEVRAENLERGGVDRGHVDGVADDAAPQHVGDLLGDLDADASCASAVEAPRWGVSTTFGSVRSSLSFASGSSSNTSRPAAATLPDLSGGDQRRFLDDAAARAVEDPHALLALLERRLVDHVMRVVGQRHVHRDVVRLREQLVERHGLDLHGLGPARREVGIVGQHAHAEGLRALGHLAADAAEADTPRVFLKQLDAGKLFRSHCPAFIEAPPGAPDGRRRGCA
jgi:hypothetical protein